MVPSIAIIMDSMVVYTHLTGMEKSNTNHTVAVQPPPATRDKTTTTFKAFRAPLPALPSEAEKEAHLNLTSQIWARTLEAVITISMCPGTLSRHPNPCLTNPSCKAGARQASSKILFLPVVNSILTTNKMSRVSNHIRRGRRQLGVRTWCFIRRCVALCFHRLRTARIISKISIVGCATQPFLISKMRGRQRIIIPLNS